MTPPASSPIPKSAPNKREALRALLADGAWHHMNELRDVGGWRYGARLLEIRQEHGVTIENRAAGDGDNSFEYRMVIGAEPVAYVPRRRRARERIEELARENADLKARVAQLEGGAAHG